MHIAIDASCWANRRGYGRYTREIITSILDVDVRNDYTLFLDSETEKQCPDLTDRANRVVVPTTFAAADAASAEGHRSLADVWAMTRAVSARKDEIDLFYFPTVYTFFPVARSLKPLVTIHDTTAERHPSLVFPRWQNRLLWKLKVAWALRQAALVLTVSNTARTAVKEEFGLTESKVKVVSNAVGPEFRRTDPGPETGGILAPHGLDAGQRFILYVGGISPHKNIETLVDAYCRIVNEAQFTDLRLVLVGDFKDDVFYSSYQSLQARLKGHRAEASAIFTGFVPDDHLPHWYSAAQVLVMPSMDEGFGLPALEALACGTPVVASRAGALPEVVGDAGLLFDPHSVDELTAALRRLLGDQSLHRALSLKGLDRASRFTWASSARSAIDLFEEVVERQSQSE